MYSFFFLFLLKNAAWDVVHPNFSTLIIYNKTFCYELSFNYILEQKTI